MPTRVLRAHVWRQYDEQDSLRETVLENPVMIQYRIGIDLGGTKIEIAVLAPDGNERLRHRIDTPHGYQASLEGIAGLVRDAEAQLGIAATVGIGIPGVISPATGLVKNANSIALNG